MEPLVIPQHLDTVGGALTLTRAWFERLDEGYRRLSFEGRDEAGALRAGLAWFDPQARPARVRLLPHGSDPKLPGLAPQLAGGELLVHRAGRRAVLRTPHGFVKVLRPGKLASAEARAHAFQQLSGRIRTPRVLASTADGALTVERVPGESLHQLGTDPERSRWLTGWQAWADAWPEWVRAPGGEHELNGRLGLPRYGMEQEGETLRGWLRRVELARPAGLELDALRERFGRAMTRLEDSPEGPWLLSHRDLHDKQLLVDPGGPEAERTPSAPRVGLIDSDTLALADPALDLGNLLAHVRLRVAQGLLSPDRAGVAEQLIRSVADELAVPDAALAACCATAEVRLECVYAFRPAGSAS